MDRDLLEDVMVSMVLPVKRSNGNDNLIVDDTGKIVAGVPDVAWLTPDQQARKVQFIIDAINEYGRIEAT